MNKINLEAVEKIINSELADKIADTKIEHSELTVTTKEEELLPVLKFLKSNDKCNFRQLIDIAAVDYPEKEKRFEVIYLLLSHDKNLRIKVLISINLETSIQSISKIFPAANWMEREVFDMYGIKFKNHPDLRSILTDYNFKGHPF